MPSLDLTELQGLFGSAHKQALQVDLATENANDAKFPIPYETS